MEVDGLLAWPIYTKTRLSGASTWRPRRRRQTWQELVSREVDPDNPRLVMNTWIHFDHCGRNDAFAATSLVVQRTHSRTTRSTTGSLRLYRRARRRRRLRERLRRQSPPGNAGPAVYALVDSGRARLAYASLLRRRDGSGPSLRRVFRTEAPGAGQAPASDLGRTSHL